MPWKCGTNITDQSDGADKKMKTTLFNSFQWENHKQEIEKLIADGKPVNLSYEKAHKQKTMAQVGFLFAALIAQCKDYFDDCGFVVDDRDIRYYFYDKVSKMLPEIVSDCALFGRITRIKHLDEYDRATMSKFIDGVFQVIDSDPIFAGITLTPDVFYNFAFHLTPEEIQQAQTTTLPERDPNYLEYIRTRPCIICGIQHRSQAHHAKIPNYVMVGKKSPDFCAIPLCYEHHINGAHKYGHKWVEEQLKWLPLDLLDFCRVCYIRWKNKGEIK